MAAGGLQVGGLAEGLEGLRRAAQWLPTVDQGLTAGQGLADPLGLGLLGAWGLQALGSPRARQENRHCGKKEAARRPSLQQHCCCCCCCC